MGKSTLSGAVCTNSPMTSVVTRARATSSAIRRPAGPRIWPVCRPCTSPCSPGPADPAFPQAHYQLGLLLDKTDRPEEAIPELEAAVARYRV